MEGFSFRKRSTVRPVLVVAVLVVAALAVARVTQASTPPENPPQGPTSAIDACGLPGSAQKGGSTITFEWQLAVRLDSPEESSLVFISGSNLLECDAWRGSDGVFSSAVTSVGGYTPTSENVLTYDTGSGGSGGNYPSVLVIGRVPTGTASVDVITADGERHSAAIGNGWYMAWAPKAGPNDDVVVIDARDSAGHVIAELADPAGLDGGESPAPASS